MTQDRRNLPPAPPDDLEEDADPGLARERTDLAWTRSSLSFAAVGVAVLRRRPAVGIPILALSLVVWSIGHVPRSRVALPTPARMLLVTVVVTALAVAALVLTLLAPNAPGLHM